MKLNVHMLYPNYDEEMLSHLRAKLHASIRLTTGLEPPVPAEYHILVTGRPSREQITASPNLHTLVIPWAGLPESTRALMLDFPHIAIHNLHHNALPVAELAITLLLAAAKRIVPMDRSLRAHDWTLRYQPNPTIVLHGKTALILGFGAIGREVARLCRGLGMNVFAVRRSTNSLSGAAEGVTIASLEVLPNLLPQADAVMVCLPHTPDTTGFLGAEELALLPSTAVLVNIGRGPIVDEAALYHALCDRRLHAAGLDVWYNYPADEAARPHTPPSAYPFHELDNVVMSPHRAGHSEDTEDLRITHLAELLNTAARGDSMPNKVDLQAGY
jgi:phosphoglycerate dehydrogenase-like enzyme